EGPETLCEKGRRIALARTGVSAVHRYGSFSLAPSEHRPSLAAGDRTDDGDQAEREQDPVHAMQPLERDLRCRSRPFVEVASHNERLCHEQDNGEQQPHANHRVHPPELRRPEPVPQIKARRHVEAGQADDDDGYPRLPSETMFDRVEGPKPITTKVTTANCWQGNGGHDRDTANPNNHGEDM